MARRMVRPLMRLTTALRHRLAPLAHQLHLTGPYRGHLDGYTGHELCGWVVRSRGHVGRVRVGLFVGAALLQSQAADRFRADVQAAGLGDGYAGFAFRLDPVTLAAAQQAGGVVSVRVLASRPVELGRYTLPQPGTGGLVISAPQLERCRNLLAGDLARLHMGLEQSAAYDQDRDRGTPALRPHQKLFEPASPAEPRPAAQVLPAYLDYTRLRLHQERRFDVQGNPEDRDHFLHWYLAHYAAGRGGLRVPLSRDLIGYLNAPLVMGGQAQTLSRVIWWRLLQQPARVAGLDLQSSEGLLRVLFWWAWQEAPALHVEDCLVPRHTIDLLASVPVQHRDEAFALSVFMTAFHTANPQLDFIDPRRAEDRQLLYLVLIVMAVRRPDLLRYLPPVALSRLLEDPPDAAQGSRSLLASFVRQLSAAADHAADVTENRFAALLRLQGYDLASHSFLSLTPQGDRLHSAALPAPAVLDIAAPDLIDVQLIGPFEKSSGLGQSTRLCADVLRQVMVPQNAETQRGLRLNCVNFGLDNPAPEGFSHVGALAGYKPARINLIHLNAETIPLAFAYAPDVFSHAYNIGFVYWELDRPADCQRLGMDLLDEIWVASDYGLTLYQPDMGDKPVVNVGICSGADPAIDKPAARAALIQRLRLDQDAFICLMAFDSYSFAQRKNPVGTIEAFQRAFPAGGGAASDRARLILKTQNRDHITDPAQSRLWARINAVVARDPRILVLNEMLDAAALTQLKAAVDCYISLHRSEGWGFNMIEAMSLQVPVVCTNYSGNLEFCTPETAWLVRATEVPVGADDYIYVPDGAKWAEPDLDDAARALRAVYADPVERTRRTKAALHNIQQNFSTQAIARRYAARLRHLLPPSSG